MNRFIETICFEGGNFARLAYHTRRMNRTRREIFGLATPLSLEDVLDAGAASALAAACSPAAGFAPSPAPASFPPAPSSLSPVRVPAIPAPSSAAAALPPETSLASPSPEGRRRVKCRVEYADSILDVSYTLYRPRPVNSLRLIEAGPFDYHYKSADRRALQTLFDHRAEADDILLVRDGELTDTSICNIALFDGTAWHTPSRPLLAGTRREALLDAGLLSPRRIRTEDLPRYTRIRLFNALLDFGEIDLPVEAILA